MRVSWKPSRAAHGSVCNSSLTRSVPYPESRPKAFRLEPNITTQLLGASNLCYDNQVIRRIVACTSTEHKPGRPESRPEAGGVAGAAGAAVARGRGGAHAGGEAPISLRFSSIQVSSD